MTVTTATTATTSSGARYIARFTPQAWIGDSAIEINHEGDDEWDCTAFIAVRPAVKSDVDACLRDTHEWLDRADLLKGDPAAPEWVRLHRGPFEIHVRWATEADAHVHAHVQPTSVSVPAGRRRRTEAELASLAICAQEAVNVSGLVKGWARWLDDLWEVARQRGRGTAWVNAHPVNVLMASKLADLTLAGPTSTDAFVEALEACKRLKEHPA